MEELDFNKFLDEQPANSGVSSRELLVEDAAAGYYDAAASFLAYKGIDNSLDILTLLKGLSLEQKRAISETINVLAPLDYRAPNAERAATLAIYSIESLREYVGRKHIGSEFVGGFINRLVGDAGRIGVAYDSKTKHYVLGEGCYGKYDLTIFKPVGPRNRYCKAISVGCTKFVGTAADVCCARAAALRVRVSLNGDVTAHPTPTKTQLPNGIVSFKEPKLLEEVQKMFLANHGKYDHSESGIMYILAKVAYKTISSTDANNAFQSMKKALGELQLSVKNGDSIVEKVLSVVAARQSYNSKVWGIVNTTYHYPSTLFSTSAGMFDAFVVKCGINSSIDLTESTTLNALQSTNTTTIIEKILKSLLDKEVIAVRFNLVESSNTCVFKRVNTYLLSKGFKYIALLPAENGLAANFCVAYSVKETSRKDNKLLAANSDRIYTAFVAMRLYNNHAFHSLQINTCQYAMINNVDDDNFSAVHDSALCKELLEDVQSSAGFDFSLIGDLSIASPSKATSLEQEKKPMDAADDDDNDSSDPQQDGRNAKRSRVDETKNH